MQKFPDALDEEVMDLDTHARTQKFGAAAGATLHSFMKEMCLCMEEEHLPSLSELYVVPVP